MVVRQRSSDGTSARRWTVVGLATAMVPLVAFGPSSDAAAAPPPAIDLSTYVRVGRYDLPEPTSPRPTQPARQEASGVTYNPVTARSSSSATAAHRSLKSPRPAP